MLMRKSRISLKKQKELLKQFVSDTEAYKASLNVGVSRNTAYFYYTHFREAIFKHSSRAPRFDGEIEVDETTHGGYVPKVRRDGDYGNTDQYLTQGQRSKKLKKYKHAPKILLLGIQKRGGDIYFQIIKDRTAETLLPVIHMVVEKGATIYTDAWSGYNKLNLDGYKHVIINHSKKFAQRRGEHVNTVESAWREIKPKISRYRGGFRHNFPLHLKEQEFRWNYRKDKKKMAKALKQIISEYEGGTG